MIYALGHAWGTGPAAVHLRYGGRRPVQRQVVQAGAGVLQVSKRVSVRTVVF